MIAIIDYGLGNINNVTRAIQHLGYDVILTCDDKDVQKAEAIVLPGVGHFQDAMHSIEEKSIKDMLKNIHDKPIIGICLGMQLLFQHSAEGDVSGLELVPGNIVPIQSSHPIPHLGWNELKSTHPLLQSDVYFVHSYQAEMSEYVVAYADYGTKIPGVIQYRNYIGIQFHPEKSGTYGLEILNQALKGGFIND